MRIVNSWIATATVVSGLILAADLWFIHNASN
jgi:hypothetical protein